MFTVEDVNSVLLTDKVNDFHSVNTSLRGGLDYVLLDFVKVRKTDSGFSFTVDNSLWSGGFYLTTTGGEYIPLTSSDYSYSDGVLSVVTDETDVVLVLYCSSFFSVFSLQYLDCRLDSLMSVVNEINLTVDDFTSLNGTAITDNDISVSGEVITCRGNTFYRSIVEIPTPITFTIEKLNFYDGNPNGRLNISTSDGSVTTITVKYDGGVKVLTEVMGVFIWKGIDLSGYGVGTDFNFEIIYNDITYPYTVTVEEYRVWDDTQLRRALENKANILNIKSNIYIDSDIIIDYPVTLHNGILTLQSGSNLIISDNSDVTFEDITITSDTPSTSTECIFIGENANVQFKNTSLNYLQIISNEDVNNTEGSLTIENTHITQDSYGRAPMILYDGELLIKNTTFSVNKMQTGVNLFEPACIHMTGGRLTLTENTGITLNFQSRYAVEGYNLCFLMLSEDSTFNNVLATEVSPGNPSLLNNVIGTTTGNYKNGDSTIPIYTGLFVAVEDKKIKNIKED